MVAPLLLLGCSIVPRGPATVHGPAPVPPLPVLGQVPSYRPAGVTRQYVVGGQQTASADWGAGPGASRSQQSYAALNQPYAAGGRSFVPHHQSAYDVSGGAGPSARPELMPQKLTALHATLPVPSLVEVTNLQNECGIIVRIVGRGATSYDRIIELSATAAKLLRISGRGDVRVRYVGAAPEDGGDVAERQHIARYPGLGCTR
jgi:rare lipoprotein A (peptidoglycan hydrolase)